MFKYIQSFCIFLILLDQHNLTVCNEYKILVSSTNETILKPKVENALQNASVLLDEFLRNYDRRLRPGFGGLPTRVDVNMNIRSIGPVSEIHMLYQMDCYFRQSWVDKRLKFTGPLHTLPVSIKLLKRIWKPDTHFLNGKNSYLHTVTTPNKLLRINRDGRLLLSMRLTIKASCPMYLQKYPMDVQICPIRFGSHGYGKTDIIYIWTNGAKNSIKISSDVRLSQYDLVGMDSGNDTVHSAGQMHSILKAKFILKRHTGYFLINFYMPCSLLVVISWVGFWINREATSDRIALEEAEVEYHERWKDWKSGNGEIIQNMLSQMHSASWADTLINSKCELNMNMHTCKKIDPRLNIIGNGSGRNSSIFDDKDSNTSFDTLKTISPSMSLISTHTSPRNSKQLSDQLSTHPSSVSQKLQNTANTSKEAWRNTQVAIKINNDTSDHGSILFLHRYGMSLASIDIENIISLTECAKIIDTIRNIEHDGKTCLAISVECHIQYYRTGHFEEISYIDLIADRTINLSPNEKYKYKSTANNLYINNSNILKLAKEKCIIYIDDAKVVLRCKKIVSDLVVCEVLENCRLFQSRNLVLSNTNFDYSLLNISMIRGLQVSITKQVDCIILPWIENEDEINCIRKLLDNAFANDIQIFAKICSSEAVDNITNIINVSDGIVISRNHLKYEFPIQKLMTIQKKIIAQCNAIHIPVIVEGDVLTRTILDNSRNQSEIFDISNCVLDGADCILLELPLYIFGKDYMDDIMERFDIMKLLNRALYEAELTEYNRGTFESISRLIKRPMEIEKTLASTIVKMSIHAMARAIIVISLEPILAREVARYHPRCPVISFNNIKQHGRINCIYRGITNYHFDEFKMQLPVFNTDEEKYICVDVQYKETTNLITNQESSTEINSQINTQVTSNDTTNNDSEKDKVISKKNVFKKVLTRLNRLSLQKKFDKFIEAIIEMLIETNVICPDSKIILASQYPDGTMLQWGDDLIPKIQILDVTTFMDVDSRQTNQFSEHLDTDDIVQSEIVFTGLDSDAN